MGRLIDEGELVKVLKERATNEAICGYMTGYDVTNSIIDEVNEQPTAYDPDKVVQQLEEKTELAFQRYMNCPKNSPCYQRYQEQYLQRKMCLEIVKAGGADAKTDS